MNMMTQLFNKTIVVDLDGVIIDQKKCKHHCDYERYPENHMELKRMLCPVNVTSIKVIHELRVRGLRITIHTARIEAERAVTERYLESVGCEYDELVMDKPTAILYIDDNGFRFTNWGDVLDFLLKMKILEEKCTVK